MHFDIPNGHHSRGGSTGPFLFVWNTTDGPGTVTQYKFQVGTQPGSYNKYNGSWIVGNFPPGQLQDNRVTINVNGSPTLYVRAQYVKSGQLFSTAPVPFTCGT